jgi:dTMP kinase
MAKTLKKGLFFSFEGPEGSGKSTHSRMLVSFLKRKKIKVLYICDPGSTRLGEHIRGILLNSKDKISIQAETMLYLAARAQLTEEKIIPALKRKYIVVCDRFLDATICYQGYGLGVEIGKIKLFNDFVTQSIEPNITFFLDTKVHRGLERSRQAKGFSDRIEKRGCIFHNKVRSGYLKLAKKFSNRIKTISIDDKEKYATQSLIRKVALDAIKGY